MTKSFLATNLRYWRKKRKLTQAKLADSIEISRTALVGYERGGHEPAINISLRIIKVLNISLNQLYLNPELPYDDKHESGTLDSSYALNITNCANNFIEAIRQAKKAGLTVGISLQSQEKVIEMDAFSQIHIHISRQYKSFNTQLA